MSLIEKYFRGRNLFYRENAIINVTLHMLGAFGFALLIYPYIENYSRIIAVISLAIYALGHVIGVLSKK